MSIEAAQSLTQELESFKRRWFEREQALAAKNKALKEKDQKIEVLEEYIRYLKHKHFGRSSERETSSQGELFNEAECGAPGTGGRRDNGG